ncbi:MAG: hypothetical protein ACLS7Z_10970 [Christensenellales bacterium]
MSRIPDETERRLSNEYRPCEEEKPELSVYAPSIGTMREMTDATVTGGAYADTRQ